MLKALRKEFPVFGDFKPLAIGIDKQLMAQRPDLDKKRLKAAMRFHTQSIPYLKALQSADMRDKLAVQGAEPLGSTPEEYGAYVRKELARWATVVKATGVTLE